MSQRSKIRESYRRVFETPDGQAVLDDLSKHGFICKSTFVQGDPYQTALNEGSRRMVLSILREVYKEDAEITQLMKEQQ